MEFRIYTIFFVSAYLAVMEFRTAYATNEWETQEENRNQDAPEKNSAHPSVRTPSSPGVQSTSESSHPYTEKPDASLGSASPASSSASPGGASGAASPASSPSTSSQPSGIRKRPSRNVSRRESRRFSMAASSFLERIESQHGDYEGTTSPTSTSRLTPSAAGMSSDENQPSDSSSAPSALPDVPRRQAAPGSLTGAQQASERREKARLSRRTSWVFASSSGRPLPAGLSSETPGERASLVGGKWGVQRLPTTLPRETGTFDSSTLPGRKAQRKEKRTHRHSMSSAHILLRSGSHGKPSQQKFSGRTGAGARPFSTCNIAEEPVEESCDTEGSAVPVDTPDPQAREEKTTRSTQAVRRGGPRSSSSKSGGIMKRLSMLVNFSGPTTAEPSTASSDMSQLQPTAPSATKTSHPGQDPSQKRPGLLRRVSKVFTAWRSRPPGAQASKEVSLDDVNGAQAAPRQATEGVCSSEDLRWNSLGKYAYKCADKGIQHALENLTREVRDLVGIMRTDARRLGPCYQDARICQELRPEMICPGLLDVIGSSDLVALVKGMPLDLQPAGEDEACLMESIVPTDEEARFVSLVTGKAVSLRKEALFVLAHPMHLMIMRDEKQQTHFLEIAIVDCNSFAAEVSTGREISRILSLKEFRRRSSLKISSITKAMGLISLQDVWMLDSEKITGEVGSNALYAVSSLVYVTVPWHAHLHTLVKLLRKEVLDSRDPERTVNMQLNLSVQLLAVVGCLDSHGALPPRFTMADFVLGTRGTVLALFAPVFQSSATESLLRTEPKTAKQTHYCLAKMIVAIWCKHEVDFELLGTGPDWESEPYLFFPGCDPTMPNQVKKLVVQLCLPERANIYDLLHEPDFNALADTVRHAVQGSTIPTTGDRPQ